MPRILIVHNHYRWRGGEDVVVEAETELLRRAGHQVELYTRHSDEAASMNGLRLMGSLFWSGRTMRDLRAVVQRFRPDVAHLHNIFPLISPSAIAVLDQSGVPVVQTLHNNKLWCLQGVGFRNETTCEDCLGRMPLPGVAHRCYQGSLPRSAALCLATLYHRARRVWDRVSVFLALTEFARERFLRHGLAPDKVLVKPNFAPDTGPGPAEGRSGGLFVGRLTRDKGVPLLARVMERVREKRPDLRIQVLGEGPEEDTVRNAPGLELLGPKPREEVLRAMAAKRYLLVPSQWHEPFGLVVPEAMSKGLPVLCSDVGGLGGMVGHGECGFVLPPDDVEAWADRILYAEDNPEAMAAMGLAARQRYQALFTPERNLELLEGAYRKAIAARRER